MSDRQRGIGVAKWRWSYPTLPYHAETMGKRGSRYDEANKQPINVTTVATLRALHCANNHSHGCGAGGAGVIIRMLSVTSKRKGVSATRGHEV